MYKYRLVFLWLAVALAVLSCRHGICDMLVLSGAWPNCPLAKSIPSAQVYDTDWDVWSTISDCYQYDGRTAPRQIINILTSIVIAIPCTLLLYLMYKKFL